ncbi:unnamed protein product [Adineta ricciae]|uniref:EGF-like domain-containing protein n=1 Tax=Adineta ricciae TaxID=249248 RepID=A0A815QZ85_ADIRI|nr:unnamed protein product [Adineta ricciae]
MSHSCLNNGQFIRNTTLNISYCQCSSCYQGVYCEELIPYKVQTEFNTMCIYLIIYSVEFFVSVINNVLSLQVFQRTIIGNVLSVIGQVIQCFKPYLFINNDELSETFNCSLDKISHQIILFSGLWLSAFVALEHALIVYFDCRLYGTQRRSIIISILGFCMTISTGIPMIINQCKWNTKYRTLSKRITSGFFYTVAVLAGVTYFVAILIVLINFALRVYHINNQSIPRTKIFFILIQRHLFIFIPPIVYGLCVIPYPIWFPFKGRTQAYFHCGISTVEYVFKIIVQALPDIPPVITWLIFVYPSNVYMTDFYTETWIGRKLLRYIN